MKFHVEAANDLSGASTIANTAKVDDGKGTRMETLFRKIQTIPAPHILISTEYTSYQTPVDKRGDGSGKQEEC